MLVLSQFIDEVLFIYPDKVKENRSNGLTSFIDNITRDSKHLLHANERNYQNNLTKDQRSAFLRLSRDKNIMIKLLIKEEC